MAGLMLQYYLTGNRRIFDVCREIADWVAAQQEPCGIFRNRDALIAMADRYLYHRNDVFEVLSVGPRQVEQLDPYFNAAVVAYAYALTEEIAYAAYCRYYLRQHFPERSRQMSFTYVCWGSIVPPLMEAVRRAEARHGTEALVKGRKTDEGSRR